MTMRILGSRAREQVPGTSITLLAPGFRGSLTQRATGVADASQFDLPFVAAAAGADVKLAAQLFLQLEARPSSRVPGLRSRSAMVTHPRVIVPRRPGVSYALLQTDETGASSFLAPVTHDDSEATFLLSVAAEGRTHRTMRLLMWPQSPGEADVAAQVARWELQRRPYQLAQYGLMGRWQPPDLPALAAGPVLLLLHDTFSTAQATFAEWIGDATFAPMAQTYQGRCLAFTHPTLSAQIETNIEWLLENLADIPGPFDVVAHGRGGLLARALAADGRLDLRRVCQVGTPNQGTALARESRLPAFLDAHVAMLAHTPKIVAQGVLEGALCLARFVAQGLRATLPGVEALTPEAAAAIRPVVDRSAARAPQPEWFTIGAQFVFTEGHVAERPTTTDDLPATPDDLVVPAQGCHDPGYEVSDSLHLAGVHHHGYFADPRVPERIAAWLA